MRPAPGGEHLWQVFLLAVMLTAAAQAEPSNPAQQTNLMALSLDELLALPVESVYAASRYEQKVSQAPASVLVVTAEDIQTLGYRTLAEVLQGVRGFYTRYDRDYQYVGVRGFGRPGDYNGRILLLINGHTSNDPIYDSAGIGTEFPLDLDMVERVEVVRGPSSSVYGNNAFFGVVNVITKAGKDLQGGRVSGEAGSWDSYKANFSYGRALTNGVDFALGGSYYDSAGRQSLYYKEFDDPATQGGVTRNTDRDRYYLAYGRVSYGGFTLQGGYNEREKRIPTAPWGSDYGDRRTADTDSRAYLDLAFQRSFEADWDLSARLYYDRYDYDGAYPTLGVLNLDHAYGSRWGTQWQVDKRLMDRHRVSLGVEYRDNFQQDQENYDADPYFSYVKDRRDSYDVAAYTQAEVGILTNLTLSAGARYDYHSLFGDSANPRLGLIYTPVAGSTFKALYGTAYRAPTVFEAYYAGVGYEANPNLEPETIATYELVYEQELTQHLRLVGTAYYYEIDGLISQETDVKDPVDPADDVLIYRNLESARALGGELGLEGRWTNGFRGRLSYALQRTEDAQTHQELGHSPRHLAKLQLTVPLYRDRLMGGIELLYASPVWTLRRAPTRDQYQANLTLFSQKLIKGVELSVGVYNVFDTRIEHPGAAEHLQDVIEQDGRSFRVKLTYRF